MARHRDIRNTKSHEYDLGYDDDYGQSYEDDYGVSPGTMAQFTYSRSRTNDIASFMPSESTVQEVDEDDAFAIDNDTLAPRHDDILVQSCLEMMRDVVGDSYNEDTMRKAILESHYDAERALNILMSSPKSQSSDSKTLDFLISQPPKEQRQRRNRREISSRDAKLCPAVKIVSTATPSKTGFQISASKNDSGKANTVQNSTKEVRDLRRTTENARKSKVEDSWKITENAKKLTIQENEKDLGKIGENDKKLAVEDSRQFCENASLTPKVKSKEATKFKDSKTAAEMLRNFEHRSKDSKLQISLVVIGHVDAGKSTLMGHLLFLAGEVSKRAMHKYEQESRKLGKASFAFAWVLDETGEERMRGVTMDVGLTKFETESKFVTLMDAPGHKDFIPNMITGASQADVALLVVNATTGEFEAGFDLGGQTREHSLLVRSLGISQLAVAVNKLDTVGWSKDRFDEIVGKLSTFLKQAGFKEGDVFYVPVSGLVGENLATKASDPAPRILVPWTESHPSHRQIQAPASPVDYPLRFCVTDVVRGQGTGVNVSGKVETGGVKLGSKVVVLPAGENSLVKQIERHDGFRCDFALAGDHATLTCHGVDIMKVQSGSVLSDTSNPMPVVTDFKARIIIFNIEVPITRGFPVELHYKAASEPAILKRLLSVLHKSTGEIVTKKPKVVLKGQNAMVQVSVHRAICIEEYHKIKEMGRFTLRYAGTTIAAGVVTELLR